MSDRPWGRGDEPPEEPRDRDEEVRRARDRAARQHVESLVLQVSYDLRTHPDHLRRLVEAQLGMPVWEADRDQLLGCAAALHAVREVLRNPG